MLPGGEHATIGRLLVDLSTHGRRGSQHEQGPVSISARNVISTIPGARVVIQVTSRVRCETDPRYKSTATSLVE